MKPVTIGLASSHCFETTAAHSAASMGNRGVEVVATPALILFVEETANLALGDCYEAGEASVGTAVNVQHLAAAPVGATVTATARVIAAKRRRVTFAVEVRQGDTLLMSGTHERFVVVLDRFLRQQGLTPA
jgi:fluoroacetyl-CoA thioesterase